MKGKEILRTEMRNLRDRLDKGEKQQLDQAIGARLLEVINERKVQTLHTYLPMGNEIDIYPLIAELLRRNIKVITSRSLPGRKLQHLILRSLDELESGIFDTRHPSGGQEYSGTYDLIIVPGLAFDQFRHRLGYGAGYYDVFLKDHPEAYKIGICYPFQVVDQLPVEAHDIPMDSVVL